MRDNDALLEIFRDAFRPLACHAHVGDYPALDLGTYLLNGSDSLHYCHIRQRLCPLSKPLTAQFIASGCDFMRCCIRICDVYHTPPHQKRLCLPRRPGASDSGDPSLT
jgi:hypothetical protein